MNILNSSLEDVEVYPLGLRCCLYSDQANYKIVALSRADKIRTLIAKIKSAYFITSTNYPNTTLIYISDIGFIRMKLLLTGI